MPHSPNGCQSPRDYFIEQLLTILVCGFLGLVGVLMYRNDMLQYILAEQFRLPVLLGGLGVLALVMVRAVTVWREAGELQAAEQGVECQQNHVHTANCNHLPGLPGAPNDPNAEDDHGHSHDMSWLFARMLILAFPVALFVMGIPNSGFSNDYLKKLAGEEAALDSETLKEMARDATPISDPTDEPGRVRTLLTGNKLKLRETTLPSGEVKLTIVPSAPSEMRFNDLNDAAFDADKRKGYQGQTAALEGLFVRISDKEFTLMRLKMTCCGSDAVPLKVRIVVPQAISFDSMQWVRVVGVVQFLKVPGEERYVPVILVADLKDVTKSQPKSQFEQ